MNDTHYPEIIAVDTKDASKKIEGLKASKDFDAMLTDIVTDRAHRRGIFDRKDVKKFKKSLKSNITRDVNSRIIEIILSKNIHEGHLDHANGGKNKREKNYASEDKIRATLRSIIADAYNDVRYKSLVRAKLTGCMVAIEAIVNGYDLVQID